MNDYSLGILVLSILSGIICFVMELWRPMLTAIVETFMTMCGTALLLMILIEIKIGWKDDMAAQYAFMLSILLCGIGLKFLLIAERNTWKR